MDTAELKIELLQKIIDTNNVDLLLKIRSLLNDNNYPKAEESMSYVSEPVLEYEKVRVFSVEEQQKINLAVQQYENGECISDEEAQKEIQEWLED